MRYLLPIALIATVTFTACKSDTTPVVSTDKNIVFTDTSLLKPTNINTDIAANEQQEVAVATAPKAVKPKVVTVTKIVRVVEKKQPEPIVKSEPLPAPTVPTVNNSTPSTSGSAGNTDVATTPVPEVKEKQGGWSQAAKGATIGGVGGAVAGAVIGKKKGKSAIIGGIIGAAGGYIIGRSADKKSGRVEYSAN